MYAVGCGQPKIALRASPESARRNTVRAQESPTKRVRRLVASLACDVDHRTTARSKSVCCALQQYPATESAWRLIQSGPHQAIEMETREKRAASEVTTAKVRLGETCLDY